MQYLSRPPGPPERPIHLARSAGRNRDWRDQSSAKRRRRARKSTLEISSASFRAGTGPRLRSAVATLERPQVYGTLTRRGVGGPPEIPSSDAWQPLVKHPVRNSTPANGASPPNTPLRACWPNRRGWPKRRLAFSKPSAPRSAGNMARCGGWTHRPTVLRCVTVWPRWRRCVGVRSPDASDDVPSGVGLPGRVWASGGRRSSPMCCRTQLSARAGCGAGRAPRRVRLPHLLGDDVLGVMEFFSARSASRTPSCSPCSTRSAARSASSSSGGAPKRSSIGFSRCRSICSVLAGFDGYFKRLNPRGRGRSDAPIDELRAEPYHRVRPSGRSRGATMRETDKVAGRGQPSPSRTAIAPRRVVPVAVVDRRAAARGPDLRGGPRRDRQKIADEQLKPTRANWIRRATPKPSTPTSCRSSFASSAPPRPKRKRRRRPRPNSWPT